MSAHELVGDSLVMQRARSSIDRVAQTEMPVLFTGETGTGKSVAARLVHEASARREGPFVAVECCSLPPALIESALFGHEPGAFPGAEGQRLGAFERASGGTLLLDELGELPLEIQPKLLGAIGRGEIVRVGGDRSISVDVRTLAATNREIDLMVEQGRFRRDLYFRLSSVHVHMPSLRERPEDIPFLVERFFERYRLELQHHGARAQSVGSDAMVHLLAYGYPGNVRELVNILRHASLFASSAEIGPGDLPSSVAIGAARHPEGRIDGRRLGLKEARERLLTSFERIYLAELLARHGRRITSAASEAGIGPRHLRRLVHKHALGR